MKKGFLLLSLFILALEAKAAVNGAWGGTSYPGIMGDGYETVFARLPLEGKAKGDKKYWSGDYWPFVKGSINLRWNSFGKEGFNLTSPTKEEALRMTPEEIATLSPAEKYDLYSARYEYPMRNLVEENGDPYADEWEGICHGWAPASMNHNEPTPKVMTNPDGIKIPFGSADIKALLSYYYAFGFKVANTHQMGRRCEKKGLFNFSKECKEDLNAGAFHIVLTNKIAIRGEAFLADMDRLKEVWNHPVIAFESEVVREMKPRIGSAHGTKKIVRVLTTVTYVDETSNSWDTVLGTSLQNNAKKEYMYDLELGAYGNIIGGDWRSKERPDFLWSKEKALIWWGAFDRLGELLNDDI